MGTGQWSCAPLPTCAQVKGPASAAAVSSWGGKSWSGTCCALARPSNAVSHQGTACSTTEHLKPRGCGAQLTLTPVATKLLISTQEQQYRMVLSSGELQMPRHGLAAQAGWMEFCLSAKLHQTLSHCQAAHTDREWFYCSHPVPTQTEFIIFLKQHNIRATPMKPQFFPVVKFALVHASPHVPRALQPWHPPIICFCS